MPLSGTWLTAAAAVLAVAVLAGCGGPQASVHYMTGGPDETVGYDMAVFQVARGGKNQIFLFRKTAAPVGVADHDFELTFFEVPEKSHYGWVKEDNVPAYRWVRQEGRDHLWRGTAGQVGIRGIDDLAHIHFDFQTTMEPITGTPGGVYVLSGHVQCTQDIVQAQGLWNRYGDWLLSLVGIKPQEPPRPPAGPTPGAPSKMPAKSPRK